MRVRSTSDYKVLGYASEFNTHALAEVIVYYDEGDASSEFIRDLEVLLSSQEWVSMQEAFNRKWLIPDNYAQHFREPKSEQEMTRGWYE